MRSRKTVTAAVSGLALAATLVACSGPPRPTWGPGSVGFVCFDRHYVHDIGMYGIPGSTGSITIGANICTQNVTYLYSVAPYSVLNKKGVGDTPAVDQSSEGVVTDWSNSASFEITAVWKARLCPVGSYWILAYACQPSNHLHVTMAWTAPLHVGPSGIVKVWKDGAGQYTTPHGWHQ